MSGQAGRQAQAPADPDPDPDPKPDPPGGWNGASPIYIVPQTRSFSGKG